MKIYSNFVDPKRFELKFKELEDIDFSFFFEYRPTQEELAQSEINIFACEEPNEYFGNHDWIIQNHEKFSMVLSWSERVLNKCPNAELLIYGESWLDDGTDKITKPREKVFEVSHLRGAKLNSYGHWLRHSIYNRQDEITVPIKFYPTVEPFGSIEDNIKGKELVLGSPMFSVVIENTSHNNYFTEKITDCMLMKTIPIYWGCSNIAQYYDIDGIFRFNSDDEAINLINSLTPDLYEYYMPWVKRNYIRAFNYKNYITRIKNQIVEAFKNSGVM